MLCIYSLNLPCFQLIDQLMQMVNKLETDRNNYSEQMRDVRGV